jgi:hypothetical protein
MRDALSRLVVPMRRSAKRVLSPAFLGVFLAACSALGDNPATLFADPSKYQYSNCEQLAAQRKIWSTREQDLKLLMDRAERLPRGGSKFD